MPFGLLVSCTVLGSDILFVTGEPDCGKATPAELVVNFVLAALENVTDAARMKPPRTVFREFLLIERSIV